MDAVAMRRLSAALLAGCTLPGVPAVALAHAAHGAHDAQAAVAAPFAVPWSLEPWVLACLALSLGLYLAGLMRLRGRVGRGWAARRREASWFAGGWLCLAAALVSPLDALGDRYFSAHMVQHEVLMLMAAPLLVLGRPFGPWMWALSHRWRLGAGALSRRPVVALAWTWLTRPLTAWTAHALALWAWHIPALFDAALANDGLHTLQHFSFLGTALLFWWSVLDTAGHAAHRSGRGGALLSLFATMMHTGALGALLTFAGSCWYLPYVRAATAAGIDPLADQQLGGLIMWIPGGTAYVVAAIVIGARALAAPPVGTPVALPAPTPRA